MGNQGMLRAMGDIARPVIKAYHDDLRVHDARVIEAAQPGDVFLWAPREHGTHLIALAKAGVPNKRAREHYEAAQSLGAPVWYLMGVNGAEWTITPCTDHAAVVARWDERARRTPEPVSVLYL